MEGHLQRAVGRSLKVYRQARGLSQEAFAEVLGVHRTYMGGLERGEHNLTLRSLERIARRLDLDPMTLLMPAVDQEVARGPVGRPSKARSLPTLTDDP